MPNNLCIARVILLFAGVQKSRGFCAARATARALPGVSLPQVSPHAPGAAPFLQWPGGADAMDYRRYTARTAGWSWRETESGVRSPNTRAA